MVDSGAIAEFCAFTSAEPETAVQYLEANDGNLQQAVELFFATGGVSIASQTSALDPTQADAGAGGAGGTGNADDGVRERIEGTTDQILDPEAQFSFGMMRQARRAEYAARRPRGVFSQSRDSDPSLLSERSERRLAELFRPPFDLIRDLPLEEAKEDAQAENRWVLVNVQDPQEFTCQRLNRDLWKDKDIKDVINAHFVFLQYESESPDGEEYRVLYPFEHFPHVAILDPWTGEQQKVWESVPESDEFLDALHIFLTDHGNPRNLDAEESAEEAKASAGLTQEAVPASKSAQDTGSTDRTNDEETGVPEDDDSGDATQQIPAREIPEPAPGPDVTRIQLRFGNGRRLVRRFRLSDPVEDVYAHVKFVEPSLQNHALLLTSERRDLVNELGRTIGDADLKNSTVVVEDR